jgi:Holliday junction resolvase-like predicted endonuclease
MAKLEAADIGHAGEKHVENWCISKGFRNVIRNTWQPGGVDIQADGGANNNIVIQVKSAISPNQPATVTNEERAAIIARGKKLGRIPYGAYVVMNGETKLMGDINFVKFG